MCMYINCELALFVGSSVQTYICSLLYYKRNLVLTAYRTC